MGIRRKNNNSVCRQSVSWRGDEFTGYVRNKFWKNIDIIIICVVQGKVVTN